MKSVRWNGGGTVTDSVLHYVWTPGQVYKVKNSVADVLLTNSDFSIVDKAEADPTPDVLLEEETLEYVDTE